jgi:hypothetical protein
VPKPRRCPARIHDAFGSFGAVHLYGTGGQLPLRLTDTYAAFRGQLLAWVDLLRTGLPPLPFAETVELMAALIAGRLSRERGGVRVDLRELLDALDD